MGRRGPKKQAELSIAPEAAPSNDREAPLTVRGNPVAAAAWENAVEQLVRQGIYQTSDKLAVERYAILAALCAKYEKECLESGGIQVTSTGYKQLSAELSCFLKTSGEMRSLERALGLNPEARRSMSLGAIEGKDELSAFLDEAG